MMSVAVIGAGAAGLSALRHLLRRSNFSAVVFEMTDRVGGTWVYNENTGVDTYGLPIQSSVYSNLRFDLLLKINNLMFQMNYFTVNKHL